jgi:hypothetical protein
VLDGHSLELLHFQDARALRDPDGLTSHVAMTFRALTQPEHIGGRYGKTDDASRFEAASEARRWRIAGNVRAPNAALSDEEL